MNVFCFLLFFFCCGSFRLSSSSCCWDVYRPIHRFTAELFAPSHLRLQQSTFLLSFSFVSSSLSSVLFWEYEKESLPVSLFLFWSASEKEKKRRKEEKASCCVRTLGVWGILCLEETACTRLSFSSSFSVSSSSSFRAAGVDYTRKRQEELLEESRRLFFFFCVFCEGNEEDSESLRWKKMFLSFLDEQHRSTPLRESTDSERKRRRRRQIDQVKTERSKTGR